MWRFVENVRENNRAGEEGSGMGLLPLGRSDVMVTCLAEGWGYKDSKIGKILTGRNASFLDWTNWVDCIPG